LLGPSQRPDGTANLVGALRRSMATTGYSDVKEFQRVDVVLAPNSSIATTPGIISPSGQ
jgi:IMP dehydrogenase